MKKNNRTFKSFIALFATVAVMLTAGSLNVSAQEEPMTQPEIAPEFPGGTVALLSLIQQNIKYPEEAKEQEIQGRVIVQFTIEKDGSVTDVKVVKSVHPLVDEQVVRAVSAMPAWKPGMHEGKPVRVSYSVPFRFRLQAPPKDIILVQYAKGQNGKKDVTCTLTSQKKLTEQEQASVIEMKDLDSKLKEVSKKNTEGLFALPNTPETMDEFNTIEEKLNSIQNLNVTYKQN
jgi:protein TonB